MSCCGGNCGCGTGCNCGSGCKGCSKFADLSYGETNAAAGTLIIGVAPRKGYFAEGSEMGVGAEGGCKCGSSCTCDPCTCK